MIKDLDLKLKGNNKLPDIVYNPEKNLLTIEGRSIAEFVTDYYQNIFNWLDIYKNEIKDKVLTIHFKLEYINTSSMRMLAKMIKILKEYKCIIYWYFEEDDEIIKEIGEDFEVLFNRPFNFVEIED